MGLSIARGPSWIYVGIESMLVGSEPIVVLTAQSGEAVRVFRGSVLSEMSICGGAEFSMWFSSSVSMDCVAKWSCICFLWLLLWGGGGKFRS